MASGQLHLARGYFLSTFTPALCAVISTVALGLIEYDPDYRSEWLTAESVIEFSFVMSVLNALFISLLSLTIFVNRLDKIRNSFVLSVLSWLAFPGLWIGCVLSKEHSMFVILNTVPYLIALILSLWMFRKRLAKINRPALEIITKKNRKNRDGSNMDNSIWG